VPRWHLPNIEDFVMIDTEPLVKQIEEVEAELASPLPTPTVGTMVVWYDRGQKVAEGKRAAIVTKIEGAGKVQLTVFAPNAMPMHKIGSLHISHSVHAKAHNSVSKNNGGWDYRDGDDAPDSHYDMHREMLTAKLAAMKHQLVEAEQIAAREAGGKAAVPKKKAGESKPEPEAQ